MGKESILCHCFFHFTFSFPLWHVNIWEPQMARCAVDRGGRQGTVPQ